MAIKRKAMDETPTRGGGSGDRKPTMRDLLPQVEWPKNAKFIRVRLYPGVVAIGFHDYPLYRKDGSAVISEKYKKHTTIPKMCLAFDLETQERDPNKECPYCEADVYFKTEYWGEGAVEELIDKLPAKAKPSKAELKSGFKDRDNDSSATPVAPFRYTSKVFDRLKGLKQLNKATIDGEKIPVGVDDEDHGCWINMNFDESGTGDGKYGLQKDERVPLSEVDEDYLRWDIEGAHAECLEDLNEAKRNAEWFLKHSKAAKGEGGDDEEDGYEVGDYVEFKTDDDETVQGEIIKMTDTKVVLTDSEGDDRSFSWKNIEDHKKIDKPGKSKKPAGKGKAEPEPEEDEYTPAEGDYVVVLDADDDEVAKGEVEEVDAKTVTVGGEAYRKARHTFKQAKKPAGKTKAKAEPEPEPDDEEDEYAPAEGDYVQVLDLDDEEVAKGEVEEVDSKTVTIDGEAYRKAKHTFKKVKKPAGKGKPAPEPEPADDDEDYTPEEGDFVKVLDADDDVLVEGKVTDIDAKTVTVEDEDGDEKLFKRAKVTLKPGKKPAKTGKAGKKPAADDDEDDAPPPRKAGSARKFNFDDE